MQVSPLQSFLDYIIKPVFSNFLCILLFNLAHDIGGMSFNLRAHWFKCADTVTLCRTASCEPRLTLAGSIRRKRGLPLSIINHGLFNNHFCTVSVVEVLNIEKLNSVVSVFMR